MFIWSRARDRKQLLVLLAIGCSSTSTPGTAQSPSCQADQVAAPGAAAGDLFGCALSVSGDRLVAGSLRDDLGGTDSGSAIVFRRAGDAWVQVDELVGSDTASGDEFGYAVAVAGATVIVGAPLHRSAGTASGAAYAFRCENVCVEQSRLEAPAASAFEQFGFAVDVDGETIAVGAPGAGAVDVFRRSGGGWAHRQRLVASDGAAGNAFGFAVSLFGDTLVVGAPDAERRGAAYVFVRGADAAWTQARKLTAPGAAAGDRFGHALALGAGRVAVGAPGRGGGAVFVFAGSGGNWDAGTRLPDQGLASGDHFGESIAVNAAASRVVVGARYADERGTDAGMAYLFQLAGGQWAQTTRLSDGRQRAGDELGLGTAIEGDTVIVGAFKSDLAGTDTGAAYAFLLGGGGAPACTTDLEIEIEAGSATVCPGAPLTWEVVVDNGGPLDAVGATVDVDLPGTLSGVTWTCTAVGGAACDEASGSGDVTGQVVDLPAGGSLLYTVAATVPVGAAAAFTATAGVEPAADREDADRGDDRDQATVTVACPTDLSVAIEFDCEDLCITEKLGYAITVANESSTPTPGARVTVDFTGLEDVSWTCAGMDGAACSPAGMGDIADTVSLPAASSVVYTVVARAEPGDLVDVLAAVAVPPGYVDSKPANDRVTEIVSTDCVPRKAGDEIQVSGSYPTSRETPSVAVADSGDFIVVWAEGSKDIVGRRFDSDGSPRGAEFEVASTDDDYRFNSVPAVALDSTGGFGVAWVADDEFTDSDVYGRRFAPDATALDDAFLVNSYITGDQGGRLAIGFDAEDRFVVVWSSMGSAGSDQSGFSIHGQRFDPDGSPSDAEFQVNSYTTGDQYHPSVAVHPGGDFVVVWRNEESSGSDPYFGILGQRFSSEGSPIEAEFQINSYTTGTQGDPRVAGDDDGNFVVVWSSLVPSEPFDLFSIRGQRFDASGSASSGELRVNDDTSGTPSVPFVTMDPGGNFIVVWNSAGDGDGRSIRGRRFAADGSTTGSELQVNTYTTDDQLFPWVGADAGGDFVVVWQSGDESGDEPPLPGDSIRGQRYELPGCSSTTLCLVGGRFEVSVEWRDFGGATGTGQVVPGSTDESGLFWFFDPGNWELLVKIVDGTELNGNFWVFAAGLTDLEVTLTVRDKVTGKVNEYSSPPGVPFATVADLDAFESAAFGAMAGDRPAPPETAPPHQATARAPAGKISGSCSPSETDLCLVGGRFRVEVDWVDFEGDRGPGRVVPGPTDNSGIFWFFEPDNWEIGVKVLDACGSAFDSFWFFSAAVTNVEYRLRVTDTETGAVKEYFNAGGALPPPILDTNAFETCP